MRLVGLLYHRHPTNQILRDEHEVEIDLVCRVGPIETAKILESESPADAVSRFKEQGLVLQEEPWARIAELATVGEHARQRLWSAVRYMWDNWWEALEEDPLPRWAVSRAMDALDLNQSAYAEEIERRPRTIRKWTNKGEHVQPCTGESRTLVRLNTYRLARDRIGIDIPDDVKSQLDG